jgi:hypothetical protein
MTAQTATTTGRDLPVKSAGLVLAGVVLAASAAFGITQMLSEGTAVAPDEPQSVITDGARDSWQGRIGPAPVPGTEHGVRDSWMPPGTSGGAK